MKLLKLTLNHFKGAKNVTLIPNGAGISVFGDNAAGKTTLADAWFWLLFGKDSRNQADFEIKTLGTDGQPMHNRNHEVSAEIETDRGTITLRRVYHEVYTKQRGSVTEEFSGHTTDYYVNGVPVQKKEYDAQIAAICEEKTFRLLTDPTFFNESLPWQKRREALLDLCGDVSNEDVIAEHDELKGLPAILGNHTVDQFRKILAARRTALNEELKGLPVRIDEASRSIPDVSSVRVDPKALAAAESRLAELQAAKAEVAAGGAIAEKRVAIRNLEGEILNLQNAAKSLGNPARDAALAKQRELQSEVSAVTRTLEDLKGHRDQKLASVDRLTREADALRMTWKLNAETGFDGENACPSCGQELPAERVAAAVEEFNQAKAIKLARIKENGIALRQQIVAANEAAEELEGQISVTQASLEAAKEELTALVIPVAEVAAPSPKIAELEAEIEAIQGEIVGLQTGATDAVAALNQKIELVNLEIRTINEAKAALVAAENAGKRIEELKEQQQKAATEFETLEHQLHLIEQFIRAKVSMLTDRINSRFQIARWKLFEEQINGGLSECCEVTVNGVPYASLNTGMRLNVGLDIIDALAAKTAFAPPIFIDGAESVTRIRPTTGQQIRLIVSEADKTLRLVIDTPAEATKSRTPKATTTTETTQGELLNV